MRFIGRSSLAWAGRLASVLVGISLWMPLVHAQPTNATPATLPEATSNARPGVAFQVGTAFTVAEGYWLTALHVVDGKELVLLGPKPQGLEQMALPELLGPLVQRQQELARPGRQEPPLAQQLLA